MFKPLVSPEISDIFEALGQGECCSVLMQIDSPKMINEIRVARLPKIKDSISLLLKNGLIEADKIRQYDIYKPTSLGTFIQQVIQELEDKRFRIKGVRRLKRDKYTMEDYTELVSMSLNEKILRLQGTMAKIVRDAIPVMDSQFNHRTNAYRLLNIIKENFTLAGTVAKSKKKSNMKISPKTIEDFPEIFDDWKKQGCYNPDVIVQYPFAIWTKEDIDKYYEIMEEGR